MGEPLKNHFDQRVPRAIARQIKTVWPDFAEKKFLSDVSNGFDDLELMDRGRAIGRALARHLPGDYPEALTILMKSIDQPRVGAATTGGMAAFISAAYGIRGGVRPRSLRCINARATPADAGIHGRVQYPPFLERREKETLASSIPGRRTPVNMSAGWFPKERGRDCHGARDSGPFRKTPRPWLRSSSCSRTIRRSMFGGRSRTISTTSAETIRKY